MSDLTTLINEKSMLKYIQLTKPFRTSINGKRLVLMSETILKVQHKNLGKRFYTQTTEAVHVKYGNDVLTISDDYRWLTPSESIIYKEPVLVVERFTLEPLSYKESSRLHIVTVGDKLVVEGFTKARDDNYLPYTIYNDCEYLINWANVIPTMLFE